MRCQQETKTREFLSRASLIFFPERNCELSLAGYVTCTTLALLRLPNSLAPSCCSISRMRAQTVRWMAMIGRLQQFHVGKFGSNLRLCGRMKETKLHGFGNSSFFVCHIIPSPSALSILRDTSFLLFIHLKVYTILWWYLMPNIWAFNESILQRKKTQKISSHAIFAFTETNLYEQNGVYISILNLTFAITKTAQRLLMKKMFSLLPSTKFKIKWESPFTINIWNKFRNLLFPPI